MAWCVAEEGLWCMWTELALSWENVLKNTEDPSKGKLASLSRHARVMTHVSPLKSAWGRGARGVSSFPSAETGQRTSVHFYIVLKSYLL